MKTVISKRLASVMPTNEEIKINDCIYKAGIKFSNGMLHDQTDKDYTINLDAKDFNFFCYNKNNKITCWPVSKGDQPVNENGQWKKEGRQEIKPGKFLLLFSEYINIWKSYYDDINIDNTIREKVIRRLCEIFADKIKGINEDLTFDFSSNIHEIYQTEAHNDAGYLNNSCMRAGSPYNCAEYSEFYNYVPGLQILYKKINDKLLFRALFWDAETEEGTKVKFLDRIYSTDAINNKLIEIAKENNWAYRTFSNCVPMLNDHSVNLKCNITQDAFNYLEENGSPYVDTLNHLTINGSNFILSNYLMSDYDLTNCEGHAVNNHLYCVCCGDPVSEDNARYDRNGDSYCEECFYDRFFYCDHCGDVYENEEMVNINGYSYCEDCAESKGYKRCYDCGGWTEDAIYSEVTDEYYCESCYCDKFSHCDHCESDVSNDEINNIVLDGNAISVCDDCLSILHYCEHCGNYFTDKLDNGYCEDCKEEKEEIKETEEILTVNN